MSHTKNKLAQESSLYLQQHADNPVDWYPWGEEAFAKAVRENKPILLSIGYSACHWCHVMANESFVDNETANLMNELFVNIKVDRQERPDLDKIYLTAHQLLTGRGGGWPLTIFMSPNGMPYFAGTYFPKESKQGMVSFKEVLKKVSEFYDKNQEAIAKQNMNLSRAFEQLSAMTTSAEINSKLLSDAVQQLTDEYDVVYGGFGDTPKFPRPMNLEFLLLYTARNKAEKSEPDVSLAIVDTSLVKMAEGGLFDHVGGGFFRYCVDEKWHIPHFEKMLYDNGQLLTVYATAYEMEPHSLFENVLQQTGEWVLREMQSSEGGFYSTLDADSEHVEGKFYVWDAAQIKSLLTAEEYAVAELYFGLNKSANFEGHWHLYENINKEEIAKQLKCDLTKVETVLLSAQKKLFKEREQRVRPARDENIIISWNALMIKGLALAGYVLNRQDFIKSAQHAIDFIHTHRWKNKRLVAGTHAKQVYLDDYAFLLDALMTMLEVSWRKQDLHFAVDIAESLLSHFYDEPNGGFYFTSNDHEPLITRLKSLQDEAIPSGNGIAAFALGRLGNLLGEMRYKEASDNTLKMSSSAMQVYPSAFPGLLMALEDYFYPPQLIVILGEADALIKWQMISKRYASPKRLVFAIATDSENVPSVFAQRLPKKGEVVAYVCAGTMCFEQMDDIHKFEEFLKK